MKIICQILLFHQKNLLFQVRVNTSTASEASKSIASNVDSCATGTEGEESHADAMAEISTNVEEVLNIQIFI